jgi:hypothetical protein
MNHMKQLVLALHEHHGAHRAFPAGAMSVNNLSWRCYILPYMEQQAIHDELESYGAFEQGEINGGTNNEGTRKANLIHAKYRIETFLCPTAIDHEQTSPASQYLDDGRMPYVCHYMGIHGPVGINPVTRQAYPSFATPEHPPANSRNGYSLTGVMMINRPIAIKKITDGTSNTLILGELYHGGRHGWARGCGNSGTGDPLNPKATGSKTLHISATKNVRFAINFPLDTNNDMAMQSLHPSGAVFALADGSVTYLTDDIDMQVYLGSCSRNGGELVELP